MRRGLLVLDEECWDRNDEGYHGCIIVASMAIYGFQKNGYFTGSLACLL